MAGFSVERDSAPVLLNDGEKEIAGVSKPVVYLTLNEIIIYIMGKVSLS